MIRITAGIYKGRKLISPKGDLTRPTAEKLRATIFNICQTKIEGARFLDLFAGSGAIGLESLSRGAAHATLVDQSRAAALAIKQNIALLQVESQTTLLPLPALKALTNYQGPPFDILYIDPPYKEAPTLLPPLFALLDRTPSLYSSGAWIFVEQETHNPAPLPPLQHILLHKTKKMGTTELLHFQIN